MAENMTERTAEFIDNTRRRLNRLEAGMRNPVAEENKLDVSCSLEILDCEINHLQRIGALTTDLNEKYKQVRKYYEQAGLIGLRHSGGIIRT